MSTHSNMSTKSRSHNKTRVSKALTVGTTTLGTSANLKLNILPRSYTRTMTYAQTVTLTTGAAGVVGTEQVWLLNSCYDPDYTGVGHQPYGFDQLSGFYANYLVHSFKVKLILNTIGSTAEVALVWKLDQSIGGVAIAGMSLDRATEAPMIGTVTVGPSGVDRARQVQVSGECFRLAGITRAQYKDQTSLYGALTSASPSNTLLLRTGLASYSGAAGTSLVCQIVLEMQTEFFNPIQQTQS